MKGERGFPGMKGEQGNSGTVGKYWRRQRIQQGNGHFNNYYYLLQKWVCHNTYQELGNEY
jgi:hypothetical protein